jgi:hypothetical protein
MTGWTNVLIEVVGEDGFNNAKIFKMSFGNPVIQEYGNLETIISILKEIYLPMTVGEEQ